MANGLAFNPAFRGPGSPGAPGVGSTRRGLALADIAQQQRTEGQLGLLGARDQAKIQSLVSGAQQLKQIRDPAQKISFLQDRIQQLDNAGISSNDTREALALAQAGDFGQLEQITDQAIQLAPQLAGGAAARGFAPIETVGPGGERGLSIPTFDPRTRQAGLEAVPLGDVELAKETAQQKRQAELEAATAKERGKLVAQQRQKINTEINANARQARRELPKLDKLLEGLDAVSTGKFAQAKLLLGPFIPGIDPTNVQVAQQQINESILGIIGRFTGAISEGEREFSARTTANLGLTNEANRVIVQNLKGVLQASIEEEKQFKSFKKEGGKAEDFEFSPGSQPLGKKLIFNPATNQLEPAP